MSVMPSPPLLVKNTRMGVAVTAIPLHGLSASAILGRRNSSGPSHISRRDKSVHSMNKLTVPNITERIQQLERQRLDLLARIGYSSNISSELMEARGDLLVEYNRITHLYRDAIETSRNHSPDKLPPEVWLQIIREVVSDDNQYPKNQILLLLTLVNQNWATFILQTPSLWQEINITKDAEDFEAIIALHLELSKPASITLIYTHNSRFMHQAMPLLLPYVHRIEKVIVFRWSYMITDPFLDRQDFSSLRNLWVWGADETTNMPLILSQSLSSGIPIAPVPDKFLWNGLRVDDGEMVEIRVTFTPSTLQWLENFSSLEHLSMSNRPWDAFIGDTPELSTTPRRFESLDLSYIPWSIVKHLVGRCGLYLQTLMLNIEMEKVSALFQTLNELPILSWLHLVLENGGALSSIEHGSTSPHVGIKRLTVIFPWHEWPPPSVLVDLTPLMNSFIAKVPRVTTLSVRGSREFTLDPTVFSCLSYLLSLDLGRIQYHGRHRDGHHYVPSSSTKSIAISGNLDMLHALSSDSAERVTFQDMAEVTNDENVQAYLISDKYWGSLTTLSLHSCGRELSVSFAHIQLSKLRSLAVSHGSIAASIFHRLSLQPDDLPVLQELSTFTVPEWDIFVIMLQKRLMAQVRGITPLQKIKIPSKIPRNMHSSLIRHLQGYIVDWPSNDELSIYANIGIVIDPSIPGCRNCHLNRVHCSTPVTPEDKERIISLQDRFKDLEPYPNTVDDILATWESRFRKTWQYLWGTDIRWPIDCSSHYMEITGDSHLEGEDVYFST